VWDFLDRNLDARPATEEEERQAERGEESRVHEDEGVCQECWDPDLHGGWLAA
jgi:hypothetical protein